MATAETDLNKPEDIVARKRGGCRIVHPSRFVTVKPKNWLRFFGNLFVYETYVDSGDITQLITVEDIREFALKENVRIIIKHI